MDKACLLVFLQIYRVLAAIIRMMYSQARGTGGDPAYARQQLANLGEMIGAPEDYE